MCAALRCMLPIDERIILFAVLVAVCEGNFDVFALQMNNRIQGLRGHVFVEQIEQAVFRKDLFSVVIDCQPGIEIGVITQHGLNNFILILIIFEKRIVRHKINISSSVGRIIKYIAVVLQFALHKFGTPALTIAITLHNKTR